MTTINKEADSDSPMISAQNPQGHLPEIHVPEDYKVEQMEFKIETAIDSKKQFEVLNTVPENNIENVNPELTCEINLEAVGVDSVFSPDESSEPIDSLQAPLTVTEPISLPAALCDDLLLAEINSIPDKMGFKIGDVADLLEIKQYVLRYWESEFDLLKPKKAQNNQRLYTKKDVENAFLIRKLLHRDRFSIEGARSALKGLKAFVKKENLKEKEIKQAFDRIDSYHERLDNIAFDVRRIRQMFR